MVHKEIDIASLALSKSSSRFWKVKLCGSECKYCEAECLEEGSDIIVCNSHKSARYGDLDLMTVIGMEDHHFLLLFGYKSKEEELQMLPSTHPSWHRLLHVGVKNLKRNPEIVAPCQLTCYC